jgi:hypothetical protein
VSRVLCSKTFGPADDPILYRLRLIQTRWFGVHVHCMLKGDPPQGRHGHPWGFVSFLLAGEYEEKLWDDPEGQPQMRSHTAKLRPLVVRQAQIHRIDSVQPPCWTLVVTGPARAGAQEGGAGCEEEAS